MRPRSRRLVALASLVFLVRAVFALAVIPPWQHPDEPQHFEAIRTIAIAPRLDFTKRADPAVEQEIFQSMAAFGWWRHVGQPEPVTVPPSFAEDPYFVKVSVQGVLDAPPVYYAIAAGLVRALGLRDLLVQLYAVRVLSVVFGLATLWLVWAGTRQLFESVEIAAGVTGLLAVHPQFLLSATSANPDALVNLLAALIYWQFARLATGRQVYGSFGVILLAAVAAVFTKRSGAPLLVMAGVAAAWLLIAMTRRGGRHLIASASLVALAVAAGAGVVWYGGPEIARLSREWSHVTNARVEANPLSLAYGWTFTVTLLRSAWLWFGWMSYPSPAAWMIGPVILTVAAVTGSALAVARTNDLTVRRGLIVAGLLVLVQIAAVGVIFYARGRLAQGRYLFPAIGPWLVLVWIGVAAWWPERLRRWAGVVLIGAVCLLDAAGWWLYLVPTYAR
ncbi:MAG: glycosyltransferase family 39 protein [Acidobacteria bacterium]|nr:glycosyltransferase family 39 protein [Acidobacteriota bacterium]